MSPMFAWSRGVLPSLAVAAVAAVVALPATAGPSSASDNNQQRSSQDHHTQKVRDVLVAPYLAKGNGTTNDRAAIQHALDDAAGGGTVLLPEAHTYLSGNLRVPSGVTLQIDGMLKQSQKAADFSFTPVFGHGVPGPSQCHGNACEWDIAAMHNLPFILAYNARDITIRGSGTVQLTGTNTDPTEIGLIGIAFSNVDRYTLKDLNIVGAGNYNVAAWSTQHGLIKNLNIRAPGVGNADAISIMNSRHLRVTQNRINVGDDAIYVGQWYNDPREYLSVHGGQTWWTSMSPQPVTDIEIDHNSIEGTPNHALALLPWAASAPDQSKAEISDLRFHDNVIGLPGVVGRIAIAVGCYCNDPYNNGVPWGPGGYSRISPTKYQSPIKDVAFAANTYFEGRFEGIMATNLKVDFPGVYGSDTVMNGDFKEGLTWWSSLGDAGTADAAHPTALKSPNARAALSQLAGAAGFIQGFNKAAQLFQGLGLVGANDGPVIPTGGLGEYNVTADLVTGKNPVRLFAYDTCSAQMLAEQTVTAPTLKHIQMSILVAKSCDSIQIGIDRGNTRGAQAWALLDNVSVKSKVSVVDNIDPSVTYTGAWATFSSTGDWGGSHATAMADGASVTVPFRGTRAYLLGALDPTLGIEDIYLDGVKVATVDTYAPANRPGMVVYDTGVLANSAHAIKIVRTGQKNPAAASAYIVFDALIVDG